MAFDSSDGALVDSGRGCTARSQCSPMGRTYQPSPGTTPRYNTSSERRCDPSSNPPSGFTETCWYTRWDTAQNAIKEIVYKYGGTAANSYTDRQIRFGLEYFSSNDTTNTYIGAGIVSNPPTIASSLTNTAASGGTYYVRAFNTARTHLQSVVNSDTVKKRPTHILFITDGESSDNCSDAVDIVRDLYNGTGTNRLVDNVGNVYKVKTFVIGFGSGLTSNARTCLNQIAQAGGTNRDTCTDSLSTCFKYYFADNDALLNAAMTSIIDNALTEECDGLDNDCDGQTDEGNPGGGAACTTGQPGVCSAGTLTCTGGNLVCVSNTSSSAETCDNVDNDCDGSVDEGLTQSCYSGASGTSGVGLCKNGTQTCSGGNWGACTGQVVPSAELCDGQDNDCDGSVDEDFPTKGATCNVGTGECNRSGTNVCTANGSGVQCNATAGSPTAELCDGKDNDCDGSIDEDFPTKGQPCTNGLGECIRPGTLVCAANGSGVICNAVPGTPTAEACDTKDNDCDGQTDEGCNCVDGTTQSCYNGPNGTSGVGPCKAGSQTCANGNWGACNNQTLPAAETCDGVDNDCDGSVDENLTQNCYTGANGTQGRGLCRGGTQTCSNGSWGTCNGEVTPVTDICDGADNDCDGAVDEDYPTKGALCTVGVGACKRGGSNVCKTDGSGVECSVTEGTPSAETCDGVDNDCDGSVDENVTRSCYTGPNGTSGVGACKDGTQTCSNGNWGTCTGDVKPALETCDGVDNDCDGSVDEGLTRACYTGPAATRGKGICKDGTQTCSAGSWGNCTGDVKPSLDVCDGQDNDCDGLVDEDFPDKTKLCYNGVGECRREGVYRCKSDGTGLECSATAGSPGTEICDGKDNDCDALIDEGFTTKGAACTVGVGECVSTGVNVCNAAGDGVVCGATAGNPTAELCDGKDNNCDGSVDENFSDKGKTCTVGIGACEKSGTYVCNADGSGLRCSAFAGTPTAEICDGIDNDCDGSVDEAFVDKGKPCNAGIGECRKSGEYQCRADGLGLQCSVQAGTPTAEICDGKDNDCDGLTDENFPTLGIACSVGVGQCKRDGKNVCKADGSGVECNVKPGAATAETCDGKDNDCDGQSDEDFPTLKQVCSMGEGICKNTGVYVCSTDGTKVACSVKAGPPENGEICGNGLDDDCNGKTDDGCVCKDGETQDCYTGPNDVAGKGLCKKGTQTCANNAWGTCTGEVLPAAEICDGKDNDCDGSIDESVTQACKTACGSGTETCNNGKWENCTAPKPEKEVCDGKDNDCNGTADDTLSCDCLNGQTRECYSGAANTKGIGACKAGTETCADGKWGACVGEVKPATEVCFNQTDDDCDGQSDEQCDCKTGETKECQTPCGKGTQTCRDNLWSKCENAPKPAPEVCDGKDNDCDGQTDENLVKACNTKCGEGLDRCLAGVWTGCKGQLGSTEVCDGFDNDCDGKVDNDAQCTNGSKCVDGACVRACVSGECPKGQGCVDGLCVNKTTCADITCKSSEVCQQGKCVDACSLLKCPSDFFCREGKCLPKDCYTLGCPSGKICLEGVCKPDPCAGKTCAQGEYCKDGNCIKSCENVQCGGDDSCGGGKCVFDPCKNVKCDSGKVCVAGDCYGDPCKGVNCPSGRICILGECKDDPCKTVTCSGNEGCEAGVCKDLCADTKCPDGKVCKQGKCVTDDCYNNGCPSGQNCVNGSCVISMCAGKQKTCSANEFCRGDDCVGSCISTKCGEGERCTDGKCETDPCAGKSCDAGKFCYEGDCIVDKCKGVTCDKGRICNPQDGQCNHDPCYNITCPTGGTCKNGQCINACANVTCPEGFGCEEGICVQKGCYAGGCPEGQVCKNTQCVDDPCKDKQCASDEFCRNGQCIKSCAGVTCPDGETCKDGKCVGDPCKDVQCDPGEFCDEGTCKPSPCKDVNCTAGRVCDPKTGKCSDPPCNNVNCPDGQTCKQGQCVADQVKPEPTVDNEAGSTEGPASAEKVKGSGHDGGPIPDPTRRVGGCVCSSNSAPSPAGFLLIGFCFLLVLTRRRSS